MPNRSTAQQKKKLKDEDTLLSQQKFDELDRRIKKDETKLRQFFRRIMNK